MVKKLNQILNAKNKKVLVALLLSALFTGALCGFRGWQTKNHMEENQKEIAGEVLRFHVLAASDSTEDQKRKMGVKEAVLSYLKEILPEDSTLEETKEMVASHKSNVEEVATTKLRSLGGMEPVKVKLEKERFPQKSYGDITFPKGNYQALRVIIGAGEGHNWWCVLYPQLCFTDAVHAHVPENGKEKLKQVLSAQEYDMVTTGENYKVKWYFLGQ